MIHTIPFVGLVRNTPQFKNTMRALAACRTAHGKNLDVALQIFQKPLNVLLGLIITRLNNLENQYPRMSRKSVNKGQQDKTKRMANTSVNRIQLPG